MSDHSSQNTSQQRTPPQNTQPAPLTTENLAQIQQAHLNLETYLQQDQNFERVPLGLATDRGAGHVTAMTSIEQWRQGRRGGN
ncbi:hypothetical protein LOCC1_G003838 [Lachnellula occidentalis]|uniref:Uncharacterized protein n=1 Tax=Lachnellula occidentalis TaxID=215460 RepID=A0A8H8UGU4_9HELO|nr:hypothetical protein LOCC1_G003838 [Lachnellula occidentalis]